MKHGRIKWSVRKKDNGIAVKWINDILISTICVVNERQLQVVLLPDRDESASEHETE